jgi:hypothetical protein
MMKIMEDLNQFQLSFKEKNNQLFELEPRTTF